MQHFIRLVFLLFSFLLFIACSEETDSNAADVEKDHVWKEQTDTIDKAKEVEGMLIDSAEATKNAIENQSE